MAKLIKLYFLVNWEQSEAAHQEINGGTDIEDLMKSLT
jgi:hypothetical protein